MNEKKLVFKQSNILSTPIPDPSTNFLKQWTSKPTNVRLSEPNSKKNEAFAGLDDEDEEYQDYRPNSITGAQLIAEKEDVNFVCLEFGAPFTLEDSFNYPPPAVPEDFVPFKFTITHPSSTSSQLRHNNEHVKLDSTTAELEDVDEKTASAALKGFIPFAEEEAKQERYLKYLRWCLKKKPSEGQVQFSDSKEREEFILSAQIFKPASAVIAARFESSSRNVISTAALKGGLHRPDKSLKVEKEQLQQSFERPIIAVVTNSAPSRTSYL